MHCGMCRTNNSVTKEVLGQVTTKTSAADCVVRACWDVLVPIESTSGSSLLQARHYAQGRCDVHGILHPDEGLCR
jgi:hypothetical protein